MKKIIFLYTITFTLIMSGCDDRRSRDFYSKNDFSYSPVSDTFNIGDTLWLEFSFPNQLNNEEFNIQLKEVSFFCNLYLSFVEVSEFSDSSGVPTIINSDDIPIFEKTGSNNGINDVLYDFVWKEEDERYVNEFGLVLTDTGKFFISFSNNKDSCLAINIEDIPGLGRFCDDNCKKVGDAMFYSTFEQSGEGWFQFEVVE